MSQKVLVLMGGFSAEREVSLVSGKDIAKALVSQGYQVVEHDLTDVWGFLDVLRKEKPDVVFNALHGNWGEDGAIQGMLDLLQIPYTHSGMRASLLGMDKELTKLVVAQKGVKVAEGEKMTVRDYFEKGTKIPFPYVVKPVSDGSSVGVFIVKTAEDAAQVTYEYLDDEVLVEKYIKGRELTVMCLGGKAYAVTEMQTAEGFYDYHAKYTNGVTKHIIPAELPQDVTKTCLRYAEIVHKVLGCRSVSRIDLRWNEEDGVVFLEVNTNPGMTSLSLVPEQAAFAGISYAELCAKLVEEATCRKRDK